MSEQTQSEQAMSANTQAENTQAENTQAEHAPSTQAQSEHIARAGGRTPRSAVQWIVVAVVAILMALVVANLVQSRAQASTVVPQSAAMETALGVRFSRVAVVGDGGLITVNYVVLDSQKASRFQDDRKHAPVLVSEARDGGTKRVSLMKQGHDLRPGQTYYLVYENTAGALRPGEQVTITVGDLELTHVPVL